jgi:hypothetical protein
VRDFAFSLVTGRIAVDAASTCPEDRKPAPLPLTGSCGEVQVQVMVDEFGVPGAIAQVDGGTLPPEVLDCVQGLLAGYVVRGNQPDSPHASLLDRLTLRKRAPTWRRA